MTEAWIISFVAILVRVATFWTVVPVWSALKPPRMVKMGLIISLTAFWFSSLQMPVEAALIWVIGDFHWLYLAALTIREVLLGGVLAMAFYAFVVPMQIAGSYIGQELGLNMAMLTDPVSGESNSIVARLMEMIAVVLFFVLDLHHYLIFCLHASFNLLPAGSGWRPETIPVLISGFADMTQQGLAICAPVAIVSFVALVSLLVLARAAPALNLFSVGFPVRILIGVAAMLVFFPVMIVSFKSQQESAIEFLKQVLMPG